MRSKSEGAERKTAKEGRRGDLTGQGTREQVDDDPLPSQCIITFGGSALRAGGGYAEAELFVLEDVSPEEVNDDEKNEQSSESERQGKPGTEWSQDARHGLDIACGGHEGGRRASRDGLVGFADLPFVRRRSLSKFQA